MAEPSIEKSKGAFNKAKMFLSPPEEKMRTGFLVVAHKPIASSMVKVAEEIMGNLDGCMPIDIVSDDPKERIVILDVEGATPGNILRAFCKDKKFLLARPLSLPLLLKLFGYRELDLEELARKAREVCVIASLEKGSKA